MKMPVSAPPVFVAALLLSSSLARGSELPVEASGFLPQAVVAFVMVDRFADAAPNPPDVVAGAARRFQGGDLAGLRERLPYLQALGVTHVWITPVARQVDSCVGDGHDCTAAYHGYWPRDLRGVDPHFGDAAALRALVAEARAAGIGVILDVVVNHFGYGALDPERLLRERCGDGETESCLFGLPDLRTEDPRVAAIVVERTVAWARTDAFAGFRIDAIKHVGRDVARAIRDGARAARPGFFTIAEHWGAAPGDDVVRQLVDDGAADAVLDFSFAGLARDWVSGRLRSAALAHHLVRRDAALGSGPPMLAFLDSHDVQTWAHAVGRRAPLGAPLLLFDRAAPVLTWGTEIGRRGGAGDPENRTFMPWAEAARAEADPGHPLHLWRGLIRLRRDHDVVRRGALSVVAHDDDGARAASVADGDAGFVVVQRDDADAHAIVAVARGRRLLHVQSVADDARIVDVVASAPGRATLAGGRLVLDVPADGTVAVVIAARTTP
jgi:glycosidase